MQLVPSDTLWWCGLFFGKSHTSVGFGTSHTPSTFHYERFHVLQFDRS